jgi:hypothetical protein
MTYITAPCLCVCCSECEASPKDASLPESRDVKGMERRGQGMGRFNQQLATLLKDGNACIDVIPVSINLSTGTLTSEFQRPHPNITILPPSCFNASKAWLSMLQIFVLFLCAHMRPHPPSCTLSLDCLSSVGGFEVHLQLWRWPSKAGILLHHVTISVVP